MLAYILRNICVSGRVQILPHIKITLMLHVDPASVELVGLRIYQRSSDLQERLGLRLLGFVGFLNAM